MTPELYQRLKPLYEAALDLPSGLSKEQRDQFVAEACGNDAELHQALQSLLAGNQEGANTLDSPVLAFNWNDHFFQQKRSFTDGELILSRFRIVRHIASGGMGEVYEAEDQLLQGVHVALKTILQHVAANPDLQRRFEREVLLAREVTHTNLCPIYDIFHCDQPPPGFLFLTMKLLPGETLSARLRRGTPIPVDEALAILAQVAFGLKAIHDAGIIHRDIKANNIMLDGTGPNVRLWITDFGLAFAHETDSTLSGQTSLTGTPGYIAPELFTGRPPSQASDLFAFGVVLHEIFTGQKPAPTPDGNGYVVSPSLTRTGVPPLAIDLITGCLSTEPKPRVQAFHRALQLLDPNPGRIHTAGEQTKFWTRRRFLTAAAATTTVAATGAWWKWEAIENALHPLPTKRFVALLHWPKTPESQSVPTLTGVLTAIKTELARAEAFDHDFFVITPDDLEQEIAATDHLKEICDPLGANLVLAASGVTKSNHFELFLRLLDPISGHPIREKKLTSALTAIATLPNKAVQAAAALLNLNQYLPNKQATAPQTQSAEAFTSFQQAEALMRYPLGASLDQAIVKYHESLNLDPNFALAHAKLAAAYARLFVTKGDSGALDLARGNSQRALAIDPHLVEAHLADADVLQDTGDNQGALDQVAEALRLDPSNPQAILRQAQIYTSQGQWKKSEATYRRVLEARPNWWVSYNGLAYTLDRQGKYMEAIQAFRSASAAAPGNALVLCNLGTEYLSVGNFAEATKTLKKSMEIDPTYDQAAANTSLALRCEGRYNQALPFALKAVQLNPTSDINWSELGDCYFSIGGREIDAKGAYLRAANEIERHLEIDSSDGPSWMLLALYRAKSGTPQAAPALIKKADSFGTDDMDSQLCKARVFELLGRRNEALAILAQCFSKGASDIQLMPFPDMASLRKDVRYKAMTRSTRSSAKAIS